MDMQFDRRNFGAALLGGAALAAAGPASAQRRGAAAGAIPVAALTRGDWMTQVRAQHREIDRHFALLMQTRERQVAMRDMHLKQLAMLLTGHSIAEEVALYPGLVMIGDKPQSDQLYREQQEAKVLVAQIDALPRGAPDFAQKVATLQAAVKAHVGEEENDAYPRLMRSADARMNAKMTADFRREFTRYMA